MIRMEIQEGMQFPSVVYTPEEMPETCPMIVHLHGAGELGDGGEDLIRVERHGIPQLLRQGMARRMPS